MERIPPCITDDTSGSATFTAGVSGSYTDANPANNESSRSFAFDSRVDLSVQLAPLDGGADLTPGTTFPRCLRTVAAGDPITSAPRDPGFGTVRQGALEESNVDITAELVNMITAQRSYQANAQTIKTQDQVLSTLVNLR